MQINNYFTCFLSFLIFSCTSENNIRTYGLQKTNVTKEVKLKESKVQESKGLSWVKPDSWIPSAQLRKKWQNPGLDSWIPGRISA